MRAPWMASLPDTLRFFPSGWSRNPCGARRSLTCGFRMAVPHYPSIAGPCRFRRHRPGPLSRHRPGPLSGQPPANGGSTSTTAPSARRTAPAPPRRGARPPARPPPLSPAHQNRGTAHPPADLRSGPPPRHHRGQRLGQGGGIQRLLGHPGGMLRRCPVAHSYHWHVGYPRSHRLRAVLPRALRQIHGGGWSSTHGKARRWQRMSELYLLTNAPGHAAGLMPPLGPLLPTGRTAPPDMAAFEAAGAAAAILAAARRALIPARQLCQPLRQASPQAPVLALMTEGGLAAVTA